MSAFDAAAFQALRRGAFGADLRVFAGLASTQDAAREAAGRGAGEGCLLLAEEQSAGRGRWGRRWEGRPGQSLLFTLLLRAPAGGADSLPLALGLGAVLALRGLGLEEAAVKWPNDILWRDRKLGGLLVEATGGLCLAGCGLNVSQAPGDFPEELAGRAASLRQAGLELPREALLAALLAGWEAALGRWRAGGFGALLEDWQACDALAGRPCRALAGGRELRGLALGPDAAGALRLRLEGGEELALRSAEVELLRSAAGA